MLGFTKKILLFSISLLAVIVFPFSVLHDAGEFLSMADVVKLQKSSPLSLFGFAYASTPYYLYKKDLIEALNPEVVVLGTSRVLQVRKEFFNKAAFVNAGGSSQTLGEISDLAQVACARPSTKFVILGIDREMLNQEETHEGEREDLLPMRVLQATVGAARRIYLDYAAHKFSYEQLQNAIHNTSTKGVGLSALVRGDGFRADGSYRYFQASQNSDLKKIVKEAVDARAGELNVINLMPVRADAGGRNIATIEYILRVCKENHVAVVGFVPPYPTKVLGAMQMNAENNMRVASLPGVFKKFDAEFYDMSDIRSFGGSEDEFVDAKHGTDKLYLRAVSVMTKTSSALRSLTDLHQLNSQLEQSHGVFLEK